MKRAGLVAIASVVTLVGALTATGCSSDAPAADRDEKLESAGIKPDESETQTVVGEDQTEEEAAQQLDGEIVFAAQLRPGDCFNEYNYVDRVGARQQFTTRVDCSRPHDKELYADAIYPADVGEGFVGTEELTLWANKRCLEMFENYVGTEYVISELDIGVFQPDLNTWGPPDNDRTVRCYLFVDGYNLQGSMEGISI